MAGRARQPRDPVTAATGSTKGFMICALPYDRSDTRANVLIMRWHHLDAGARAWTRELHLRWSRRVAGANECECVCECVSGLLARHESPVWRLNKSAFACQNHPDDSHHSGGSAAAAAVADAALCECTLSTRYGDWSGGPAGKVHFVPAPTFDGHYAPAPGPACRSDAFAYTRQQQQQRNNAQSAARRFL